MTTNHPNADKRRYLLRYQASVKQLEFCRCELARVSALETKITPTITGLPQSQPAGSKPELAVERAESAEQKYKAAIAEHKQMLDEITTVLQNQLTGKELLVMQWRYIAGAGWDIVAERVGVSMRWVWVLHERALDTLVLPQPGDSTAIQADK